MRDPGGYFSWPPLALPNAIDSTVGPQPDDTIHLSGQAPWHDSDYAHPEQGLKASRLRNTDTTSRPTIALCMIVREEAAVIGRCIESVRPLIDRYEICDTGSTDGTPAVVRALLADVPGRLHVRPWRDFGSNRSELLELARGSADYLLLLDADMTISWIGPLPALRADAYLLRHAGDPSYAVPRLVRGDRHWRYVGETHEYLACDGEFTQELLDALLVEHHGDGGTRVEKYTRDAALLQHALDRDPDDPRTVFYLAQTHSDLGEEERAIELYERRVAMGGWEEERFYAAYRAGVLRARRNEDRAFASLLQAWHLRPKRAEPLYELARLARSRRWYEAALTFARAAVAMLCPDDLLFVHRWIYDWGARFELAVAMYWTGEYEQALAINDALLAEAHLPPAVAQAVRENRAYCAARLSRSVDLLVRPSRSHRSPPLLEKMCPSLELAALELDVAPAWPSFNPTVAADGDGFRLIVRTANYRLTEGRYEFLEDEQAVRTINYLVTLDSALAVNRVAPLLDASKGPPTYPSPIVGYEDCRLVRCGEQWWASATVRDRNAHSRAEMVLLRLDDSTITDVTLLRGLEPRRHEKNWMPFCANEDLRFVYCSDPTIVLSCDPHSGVPRVVSQHQGPPGSSGFRGGSQGAAVGDGWLFVVHEALDGFAGRCYQHRFVLLAAGRIAAFSAPFRFSGEEIEFCAGLAIRGSQLVVTFGVGDHSAALGLLDITEALALLTPA